MRYGSMTHSFSGKKRKTNAWIVKTKKASDYNWDVRIKPPAPYVRESVYYPSMTCDKGYEPSNTLSKEERQRISSEYTVAPSYNKGAYQVIPRNEVKHIGR